MAASSDDSAPNAHLPDDPAQWPYEPARILNVANDADAKTVKRAYAKLLRLYRPEDAPEAFQKLMAARDALLISSRNSFSNTGWRRPDTTPTRPPDPSTNPQQPGSPKDPPHSDHHSSEEPAEEQTPNPLPVEESATEEAHPKEQSPSDTNHDDGPTVHVDAPSRRSKRLAAAWELALEDNLAESYLALSRLADEIPEAAVRAHWLLRLEPRLDQHRKPIDWLLDYAHRLPTEQTLELLKQWLTHAPQDSRDSRLGQLLEHPEFAEELRPIRWREFARGLRFDLLEQEWEQANWTAGSQAPRWTSLLLSILAPRTEDHAGRLADRCRAELSDIHSSSSYYANFAEQQLDLYDEILQLSSNATLAEWRKIRKFLVDVPETNQQWLEHFNLLFQSWWNDPSDSLLELDQLVVTAPATSVCLFNELRSHRNWNDPLLSERVEAAWTWIGPEIAANKPYTALRVNAINVCCSYAVAVHDLPAWSADANQARAALGSDLAAHILTLGWALFAEQM